MTKMEILAKLEEAANNCLSLDWGAITDAPSQGGTGEPLFPHLEGVVTGIDAEFSPLDQGDETHIEGDGPEGGMTPTQWVAHQRAARVAHQRGRLERGVLDAHQKRVEQDEATLTQMGVVPFHSPKKGLNYEPTPPSAIVPDTFRGAPLIVGGVEEPWENHDEEGYDSFWEGPTPHQRYLATIDPPVRDTVPPTVITFRQPGEISESHFWGGVNDEGPTPQKSLAE
jgi:hypothetical protein